MRHSTIVAALSLALLSACDPSDPNDPSDADEGTAKRTAPARGDVRLYLDASELTDVFGQAGETPLYEYRHQSYELDVDSGELVDVGFGYESWTDSPLSMRLRTYDGALFSISEMGASPAVFSAAQLDLETLTETAFASATTQGYAMLHGVLSGGLLFSDARGLVHVPLGAPSDPDAPPPPPTSGIVVRPPAAPGEPAACDPVGASGYCVRWGESSFEIGRLDLDAPTSPALLRRDLGEHEALFIEGNSALYWLEGLRDPEHEIFPAGEVELWRFDGEASLVTHLSLPVRDGLPTTVSGSDADGDLVALLVQPGDQILLVDGRTGQKTPVEVDPPFGRWSAIDVLVAR